MSDTDSINNLTSMEIPNPNSGGSSSNVHTEFPIETLMPPRRAIRSHPVVTVYRTRETDAPIPSKSFILPSFVSSPETNFAPPPRKIFCLDPNNDVSQAFTQSQNITGGPGGESFTIRNSFSRISSGIGGIMFGLKSQNNRKTSSNQAQQVLKCRICEGGLCSAPPESFYNILVTANVDPVPVQQGGCVTQCGHLFHQACLQRRLDSNSQASKGVRKMCPVCAQKIDQVIVFETSDPQQPQPKPQPIRSRQLQWPMKPLGKFVE